MIKSLQSSGWSEDNRLLLFHSKIYVSNTINLCYRIVILYYNSKIARYIGR